MKVAESEEGFDRAAPRPEPVSAKAGSGAKFRAIALALALVGSFAVGASVYFLGTTPTTATRVPVNVWMGIGAAVAIALAWFVLKKLAPKLGYVKPGQGRAARVCAYLGFTVIALFGAATLHGLPGIGSKWFAGIGGLWSGTLLGATFTLRPILFPAVAFLVAAMVGFHLFVSREKSADFLIETQGEMRRVSWPTRREWVGSTIVVLTLVAILSFFLYGVDQLLSPLMQNLRIGF